MFRLRRYARNIEAAAIGCAQKSYVDRTVLMPPSAVVDSEAGLLHAIFAKTQELYGRFSQPDNQIKRRWTEVRDNVASVYSLYASKACGECKLVLPILVRAQSLDADISRVRTKIGWRGNIRDMLGGPIRLEAQQ